MRCVTNITVDETGCLPKCSGLQISSYDVKSIHKNNDLVHDMDTAYSLQLKVLKQLYEKVIEDKLPAPISNWSKLLFISLLLINFSSEKNIISINHLILLHCHCRVFKNY